MTSCTAAIPEIVSQLADNCAGLWTNREIAARSSLHVSTFEDLTRLDDRMDAQLDGLRMSGDEGRRALREALEIGGPGEIFTCAVMGFEDPFAYGSEELLFRKMDEGNLSIRPLAVALDWIGDAAFRQSIGMLADHKSEIAEAVVLTAECGRGGELGSKIPNALSSKNGVVQIAACDAAARVRELGAVPALMHLAATADDAGTRFAAAKAALFLGAREAAHGLRELAVNASPYSEGAAETLFRWLGSAPAVEIHAAAYTVLPTSRAAVRAAGAAGVIELIPFLIEQLDNPCVARLSGEAFTAITGLDFEKEGLTAKVPLSQGAGPTESPEDEAVDLDPDEGLAWPDRQKVQQWWTNHSGSFLPMTRYLWGEVASDNILMRSLHSGLQKRRTAAAELLAMRGWPLFDVCAPSFRQAQRLAMEKRWV